MGGCPILCGTRPTNSPAPPSSPVLHSQVATLSSVALPPLSCTLSAGSTSTWLYDEEGLPQLSADGKSTVVPCYGSTAGNPLSLAATKFAAVVSPDWTVATYSGGTALGSGQGDADAPNALRTIASPDGATFYWGVAGRKWNPAMVGTTCSCQYGNGCWNTNYGCTGGVTGVLLPDDYTSTGVFSTTSTSSTPVVVGDNCWGTTTAQCSPSTITYWQYTNCNWYNYQTFCWSFTGSITAPNGAIAGSGYLWGGLGLFSGSLYASDMGGTSGAGLANGMLTFNGLPGAWVSRQDKESALLPAPLTPPSPRLARHLHLPHRRILPGARRQQHALRQFCV